MQLLYHLHNLKDFKGSVITLGNFDGMHLGHQKIIKRLLEHSSQLQLPSVLITFEPQPKEFFLKENIPARLTSLREKLTFLKTTDLQYVYCLRFDKNLASLSAQDFIAKILQNQLQAKCIVIGEDFRFGNQRMGDVQLLKNNFNVDVVSKLELNGLQISSTRVREALASGDFTFVKTLLGRAYRICGRVVYGDQRGRTIGFPTANIKLHRIVSPLHGVYLVRIRGYNNRELYGVTNVGIRPTIDGKKFLLEVHIFDFNDNLYGRYLEIEFLHKIRKEKRFASFEQLKIQITKDIQEAKEALCSLRKNDLAEH